MADDPNTRISKKMSSKEIIGINELVDEVRSIISERNFNANLEKVEMLFEVGKAIIESDLYKKGTPEARQLIKDVAYGIGKSEQWVYFTVQAVEKYGSLSNALETIGGEQKTLTVRQVIQSLPAPKEECKHENPRKDVWTITKTLCRACGVKINEKREKQ